MVELLAGRLTCQFDCVRQEVLVNGNLVAWQTGAILYTFVPWEYMF
jgi:hypothetical protein